MITVHTYYQMRACTHTHTYTLAISCYLSFINIFNFMQSQSFAFEITYDESRFDISVM